MFYGVAPIGDRFTDTNVYWLSWGGVGRSQVDVKDAAPKTSNTPTPLAFKKAVRFEQDRKYDRLLDVKSEGADHYFWESLTGGTDSRFSQKDFPIQLPHAVRGQINRELRFGLSFKGHRTKGTPDIRRAFCLMAHNWDKLPSGGSKPHR